MNVLPELLHRLERFARSRDERGVADTLDALNRNAGWADEVSRFVARMDGLDRALVENVIAPSTSAPPSLGASTWQPKTGPYAPDPLANVTKDATSGIYCPASSTEWAAFLAAKGIAAYAPSDLYLMQEGSGSMLDSIGSVPLPNSAGVTRQVSVTGWTRKASIINADNSTAGWGVASGTGPSPATTSIAVLGYILFPAAPAATRNVLFYSNAASHDIRVRYNASAQAIVTCSAVDVAGTSTYADSAVHPVLLVYNRTAGTIKLYTDKEIVTGTYAAGVTDGTKCYGATVGGAAAASYLYGAWWNGAAAEIGDSAGRTMLSGLGFSIPW